MHKFLRPLFILLTQGKAVTYLTIILSILSLSSFFQRILKIGLIPMIATYIEYYHRVSYEIIGVPMTWMGIKPPSMLIDFWVLSFICAGAYAKAENVERARAFIDYNYQEPSLKLRLIIFFVAGITGLSFFVPFSAFSIHTYARDDIMRSALKNVAIVFLGTMSIFVFSAFAPSA